jgi:hypothetical protein
MEEIWKDIPGYEGYYQASDMGRIKSVDREVSYLSGKNKVPRTDFHKSVIKSTRPRKDGYHQVNLSKDSKKVCPLVHHIIAETFLGQRPFNLDVCHNNGNRDDNRLKNIRYDTRKNNFADELIHGTRPRGEKQGSSKLTEGQIYEILKDNRTQKEIAKDYGIGQGHVSRIKRRVRWQHLQETKYVSPAK